MGNKPNPEDYELVPNDRGGFDIRKKDSGWWLVGLGVCGLLIFSAIRWVLAILATIPMWAYYALLGGLILLLGLIGLLCLASAEENSDR